jgi:predicted phosphodiesterase
MATPPRVVRQVIERYDIVSQDVRREEAYKLVASEFGIAWGTVSRLVRNRPTVETLTSSDFEIVNPTPTHAKATKITVEGKRVLEMVASDIHYPFEDQAAYALFLEVAKDLQPDLLVLLGDIIDAYAVSAHDKDANRSTPAAFQEELAYARRKLVEIRELLPNTRIIYKEGNHETRISRYIHKNAQVLSNLKCLTLPEMLDLSSLNIEWIGNDERLRIGRMWHIHGNEVAGAGLSPARLKYSRMQCSFIFGHHHQRDKHRPRAYDGSQHGAYGNPCLCDLEPEYVHHAHAWSHGFTLIDHDTDNSFQVDETEIIKPSTRSKEAKCNVRGKIYRVEL